ncbi:MAG: glycosyltransferase, partial [Thermoguttaceae bacterium]
MRVLVDALSVRSFSGQHVLLGHLRQLAEWTRGSHTFLLLHDAAQTGWVEQVPDAMVRLPVPRSLTSWSHRLLWQSVVLPRRLKEWAVDLVFTTSGILLPRCRLPQVCYAPNPWCLVTGVHQGRGERYKAALQRRGYRTAVHHAAMMCYISRHLRDLYRANAGGAVERACEVAYCGIDDNVFQTAMHASETVVRQPDLIVSVSAMAPWKGAETLVEALALLHRSGCRAKLRLVGPWPDARYERLVRQRVKSLGLNDFVCITGQVSKAELCRHYAEARVYCLMSHCESFGIPAVEAQAFGTPVVGSTACAMPEVCGAGGVFCPPDDARQAAALLRQFLEDPSAWETYSHRARENAARYRWDLCSRPLL